MKYFIFMLTCAALVGCTKSADTTSVATPAKTVVSEGVTAEVTTGTTTGTTTEITTGTTTGITADAGNVSAAPSNTGETGTIAACNCPTCTCEGCASTNTITKTSD